MSCTGGVAGRIEICVSGEWRAVCDDQWWGPADARIVCLQLGFNTQSETAIYSLLCMTSRTRAIKLHNGVP